MVYTSKREECMLDISKFTLLRLSCFTLLASVLQLWKRRAKRLATHGLPNPPSKNMNYVGSKALQALLKKHPDTPNTVAVTSQQAVSSHSTLRHNAPVTTAVPRDPPMVYKVWLSFVASRRRCIDSICCEVNT